MLYDYTLTREKKKINEKTEILFLENGLGHLAFIKLYFYICIHAVSRAHIRSVHTVVQYA